MNALKDTPKMEADELQNTKTTQEESNTQKLITYQEYKALEEGFMEERQKMEERIWLDSTLSQLDEVLRLNYDQSVRVFSDNIIAHIAKVTGAVYGAFFIVDNEKGTVKATGGYACTVETMDRKSFNVGEGLVGQAARSKDTLRIDNVETQLDSSIGRINATYLVISPLVFNQDVYGVIEINTLEKLDAKYITLLDRASKSIGSTLHSILNNQKTKKLLIESLQQAEDFKVQEEELEGLKSKISKLQASLKEKETLILQLNSGESIEVITSDKASSIEENETYLEKKAEVELLKEQLHTRNQQLEAITKVQQDLEQNTKEQESKIEELRKEITEAEAKSLDFSKESVEDIEGLEKNLEKKEQQISEYQEKSKTQSQEIERLKKEVEDLKIENTEVSQVRKENIENIIENLEKKEQQISEYQEKSKTQSQEIERLKKEVEDLKIENTEVSQVRKENIENIIENLEKKEQQISEYQEKINKLENEYKEATQAEVEQALAQKDEKIKALEAKLKDKQQELVKTLNEVVWVEDEQRSELPEGSLPNKDTESEQGEVELLKEKLRLTQEELSEARADNREAITEDDVLEHEMYIALKEKIEIREEELENIKKKLEIQPTQVEESQEGIEAKDKEIETLREKVQALESQNNKTQSKGIDIEKSEAFLEQKHRLEAKTQELDSLKEQLAFQEEEIKSLKEQSNESEKGEDLNFQLEIKNKEIENLKDAIKWKDAEIDRQDEAFVEKKREAQNLKKTIEEKETENLKHLTEIVAQTRLIEQREQEIEALRNTTQSNTDGNTTQSLESDLRLLKTKLKQKEDELMVAQYMLQQQDNQKTNVEDSKKTESFKQDIEAKNRLIEDLETRLKELQISKSDEQISFLEEALARKDAEILTMKNELVSTKTKEQNTSDKEELQKALEDLQRQEQENLQKDEALSVIRGQLLDREKSINELTQKINSLETLIADNSTKTEAEDDNQLESKIIEKDTQIHKLNQTIDKQREQIAEKQKEMQEKETELVTLFNKINTAFAALEFDMGGNILSVNNKCLMLLGYEQEEVEGSRYEKLLTEEYINSSEYRVFWEELKIGSSQSIENLVCIGNKDKRINMSVTYIPILDASGKPYEVVMLINQADKDFEGNTKEAEGSGYQNPDISADKEIEEKLKAIDKSFVILELDTDGNAIDVNEQFLTFLGYEKEDVVGQHHRNFVDITDRSSASYQSILNSFETGGFASKILKYVGKEGERVRLRSYFNPIKDSEGNTQKVLVISQFVN